MPTKHKKLVVKKELERIEDESNELYERLSKIAEQVDDPALGKILTVAAADSAAIMVRATDVRAAFQELWDGE